jgi:quercetin dioxygenase-like cupin family protein
MRWHDGRSTCKAGESCPIPAGAVHDVKAGDKGMKVMAVYMVEKGKPLASPAP